MFQSVVNYISRLGAAPQSTAFSDVETAEAVATLLRQMVLADGVIKQEEINSGIRILKQHYPDLMTIETEQHIIDQIENGDSESIFPLIAILKKNLSKKQFNELKIQLVTLAKSDQEFHPMERDFSELVDKLS